MMGLSETFIVHKGIAVVPKSITPSRILDNVSKPLSVKLSPEEFTRLDALAEAGKQQRFIKPPWPVVLGFEDWI